MTFIIALVCIAIYLVVELIKEKWEKENFEEEELAKMSQEEKELYSKRKEAQKKEREAIFNEAEKRKKIWDYEYKHHIRVENIPNLTTEQCIERAKLEQEEKIKRTTTIKKLNTMYHISIEDDGKTSIEKLLENALMEEDARLGLK